MLTGELNLLRQWAASGEILPEAAGGDACPVGIECRRIRKAWAAAAFSPASDESLKRYFRYHLFETGELADQARGASAGCLVPGLLGLSDHLWQYYTPYLDEQQVAPLAYQRRFAAKAARQAESLRRGLQNAKLDPRLKKCLLDFLREMDPGTGSARFTFRALRYFENWLERSAALDLGAAHAEARLNGALEGLNFNHLGYLHYRQQAWMSGPPPAGEKITWLRREKQRCLSLPVGSGSAYDPRLPSLNELFRAMLAEEIACLESGPALPAAKYPLNLSVAHLGCLLRLFCDGEMPGSQNLAELFRFVTAHFSSKRQADISPGSLSKAFYGTTQVTAAHVQGLLQVMLARINRRFFPVWAAISIIICAYLKS